MIRALHSGFRPLILLFCLLFTAGKINATCIYSIASASETATLPGSGTGLNNLSVCTTYNLTYSINYTGSAGPVNDNLTISLPLGITASAVNLISGATSVFFSNAGATPQLAVSGWNAGVPLVVTLTVQTPSCGPVAASPSFTTLTGTTCCNPYNITSDPLSIPVPALSITNTAINNALDKNKGDVDEIVFQIQNSSNNGASISQINVSYTSDPNTTFFGNYYISSSAAKQPGNNMYTYVPATASAGIYIPTSGATTFVMDQTIFSYFFSGATSLADGNSLYLHIPYKVTGCITPNAIGGNYTFDWGCGSTSCRSTSAQTFVNVVVGDPQLKVTSYDVSQNASFCSATSAASFPFGFTYTNTGVTVTNAPAGNARATGLKFYLFSTTTMGSIDPMHLYYSDGVNPPILIPQSIITPISSGNSLGYTTYEINFGALPVPGGMNGWDPFGPNSLADLNGDGWLDDLTEGGTLVITGNFIYNQSTNPFDGSCSGFSNYFAPAISSKYQNQCQTIPATDVRVEPYIWENTAYYLYQVNHRTSSMTAPSDVIAGVPFVANLCPVYYELWGPVGYDFKCPNGYHDIHIPLPPGYHLDPTGLNQDASHTGYNLSPITPTSGGCNGGPPVTIIPDAIETPPDTINCIAGYIDIKLGRIQFGNCSNVYNETYLLPCMNVPLIENCDGGVHCGSNFGPDGLSYTLEYICDPACLSSYSTVACANTETYHHCNGRCDSYFSTKPAPSFQRTNLGALNPPTYYGCTSNLPVPVTVTTQPPLDISAGYPGDQIEVITNGTFMGSPTPAYNQHTGASYTDMYLQIQYDALPTGSSNSQNVFDFDPTQGSVVITDLTTLSTYTVYASSMTTSFSTLSGVNYLNLNFSTAAALSQITSSTHTYELQADLHLIIKSQPVIPGTSTFFAHGFFPLVNLRMQYGGIESAITPTPGAIDGSCDSYGAPFTIEQPLDFPVGDYDPNNSCDLYNASFELQAVLAKLGTQTDDFPDEYRPYAGLDPALTITVPPGYAFVNAQYRTIRTPIGTDPNNFGTPGSYQYVLYNVTMPANGISGSPATGMVLSFNGMDGQGACWPGLDEKNWTWHPTGGIQLTLQPLCSALPTDHFQFAGSYTEGIQQSNPFYQKTTVFSSVALPAIHHINPQLSLNAPTATINAYSNTVSFNFQYCNTGTVNANDAWIAFENNPAFNALDLNTAIVKTVPGGVVLTPYVYTVGGQQALLVNYGSLPVSTCVTLELTATINSNGCVATGSPSVPDFVSVKYGNECSGLIQTPDTSCEQGTAIFSFDRFPSSLELLAGINPFPTTPVDLCDGILNYNFIINSADIGTISNPAFWMDLPPGITLQSASFSLGCNGTPYTTTSVNGYTFGPGGTKPGWDLNTDLNLGTTGLTGTLTAPSNQICVSLALKTNCSYNATDYLSFYAGGLSECSQNLVTLPLQNQPPINNATPSDNIGVQVQMTTTDGHAQLDCSNTGTVTVTLTNNGSTNTHNDVLTVSIPSAPVVTSNYGTAVAGTNTLTWTLPAGTLPASGTQTFTFDMSLNGTLYCQHNIGINAVISYNQNVSCTASGGSCAVAYSSAPVGITIDACCQCNMTATTTITNVLCNAGNSGTATVSITGGTAPFSYAWSNGQTGATATGLTAGNYSVMVTDANACSVTASVVITQPNPIANDGSIIVPACDKSATGSITLILQGGTSPYSYSWNTGGTTSAITNLTPGVYTVTVTDANGCSRTAHITVPSVAGPPISITANPSPQLCAGDPVLLCANGISGAYTWSNGQTGACITVNPTVPTTYLVQGSDKSGCSSAHQITITPPPPIMITTTATNASCYGGLGNASAAVTGGTGAYTYSWSPSGGSAATASNLVSGIYTVYVTDANHCTASAPVTINQSPPLVVIIQSVTPVRCASAPNGSATATVSGGAGSYSYSWSPTGGNASTASHLAEGTYTLFVTDANGCTATAVVIITGPLPLIVNATPSPACGHFCTGSVTTTVNGGQFPFTYHWSDGFTTPNISGLCPNTYQVTVTDGYGCIAVTTATVTTVSPPVVTVTPSSASVCPNITTTLCPSSTSAVTYSWTPAVTPTGSGNCVTVAPAVTTTYTVVGSNGNCSSLPATATITVKPAVPLCPSPTQNICAGQQVTLNTSCQTPGTYYIWKPGNILGFPGLTVTPAVTTVYTVTGYSLFGLCPSSTSITVNVTSPPTVTATAAPAAVCPGSSTVLTANPLPAGSYSYSWSGGLGSGNPVTTSPTANTTYTVTVFNGACPAQPATVPVTMLPLPPSCLTPDLVSCRDKKAFLLDAACHPTQPGLTYTWTVSGSSATATGNPISVNPNHTVTYTVTVHNSVGCTTVQNCTVYVLNGTTPVFTIGGTNPVACGTGHTYTISPSNLLPPGDYHWTFSNIGSSGVGSTAHVTVGAPGGTLNWIVTDPNAINGSCETTVSETILCDYPKEETSITPEPESAKASVRVYPNPTDAGLTVQVHVSAEEELNMCLFNSMGQVVYCEVLKNETTVLSTASYPNGIYYYSVTGKDGHVLKSDKVIIAH
jgi:hypothetical protein